MWCRLTMSTVEEQPLVDRNQMAPLGRRGEPKLIHLHDKNKVARKYGMGSSTAWLDSINKHGSGPKHGEVGNEGGVHACVLFTNS